MVCLLSSGLLVYKAPWTQSALQEGQSEGTCVLNRSVRPYHIVLCQADVHDHMFKKKLLKDIIWASALCVGRGKLRIVQK